MTNPYRNIDPNKWHIVHDDKPIAINFPSEYEAKSYHSGHAFGKELKVKHGTDVRRNAYLKHNQGVVDYSKLHEEVVDEGIITKALGNAAISATLAAGVGAATLPKDDTKSAQEYQQATQKVDAKLKAPVVPTKKIVRESNIYKYTVSLGEEVLFDGKAATLPGVDAQIERRLAAIQNVEEYVNNEMDSKDILDLVKEYARSH